MPCFQYPAGIEIKNPSSTQTCDRLYFWQILLQDCFSSFWITEVKQCVAREAKYFLLDWRKIVKQPAVICLKAVPRFEPSNFLHYLLFWVTWQFLIYTMELCTLCKPAMEKANSQVDYIFSVAFFADGASFSKLNTFAKASVRPIHFC